MRDGTIAGAGLDVFEPEPLPEDSAFWDMPTVIVTPTAGGSTLAPGQLVQARILASGGAAKSGVMVPQDAVQTLGTESVVFVRTAQGFRAQPVQIGSRSGGMVAITGGLAAGTPIATTNAFLLKAEIEKESAE